MPYGACRQFNTQAFATEFLVIQTENCLFSLFDAAEVHKTIVFDDRRLENGPVRREQFRELLRLRLLIEIADE